LGLTPGKGSTSDFAANLPFIQRIIAGERRRKRRGGESEKDTKGEKRQRC
jgi:hypothetical protein